MEEFAKLSWKILEHKILYYEPEKFKMSFLNKKSIPDNEYDALEIRYLQLCRELKQPNYLVHKEYEEFKDVEDISMIELDWTRPSVNRAFDKLKQEETKYKKRRNKRKKKYETTRSIT